MSVMSLNLTGSGFGECDFHGIQFVSNVECTSFYLFWHIWILVFDAPIIPAIYPAVSERLPDSEAGKKPTNSGEYKLFVPYQSISPRLGQQNTH